MDRHILTMRRSLGLGAAAAILASVVPFVVPTFGQPPSAETAPENPAPPAPAKRVLVDSVHANNYLNGGLRPERYDYHSMQGLRRAFEYLKYQGIAIDEMKSGRLDAARLANVDLLFLNLVSAERSPFLVSEINAIRDFIEAGGALLVITDHSNCYFHAYRLEPLFAELGMASFTDTALDVPPNTIGPGNAWLAITRFAEHPVTRDLRWLGIQTGGRVDPDGAVAFTSDEGWADRWFAGVYGEDNAPGFYGNFIYNVGEDRGRTGVVLAKTFGRGRIVNVGDQNTLGDPFLHYADNFRLWLNATAWLLGDEKIADPNRFLEMNAGRVSFFEKPHQAAVGSNDNEGFLNAFTLVARHRWTFANDRPTDWGRLVVLVHDSVELSADESAALAEHLRSGGNILMLGMYFGGLREEGSAAGKILAAWGAADITIDETRDDRFIASAPQGGKLVAWREPGFFQNAFLANPTSKATPDEEARGRLLLKLIGECIPAH